MMFLFGVWLGAGLGMGLLIAFNAFWGKDKYQMMNDRLLEAYAHGWANGEKSEKEKSVAEPLEVGEKN